MESLADGLFVAVGGLTIATYSGLLFLGAKPVWAVVLVLSGAAVLGILLNSALSILRDTSNEESEKPAARANGASSAARGAGAAPAVQPPASQSTVGERA
ncbi:MAG TPA: hypothetical protein VMW65_10215 [Chloroflexota bacterium]|nr:hypothetical protein [Chloroflexota bacterium]